MAEEVYRTYRTRTYVAVQSLLAVLCVGAYLLMVVTGNEVPSDFAFIVGLVMAFFFDEMRKSTNGIAGSPTVTESVSQQAVSRHQAR